MNLTYVAGEVRLAKRNLVADLAPELDVQLLGDARGDAGGRDAPRLGDADVRFQPAAHGEADPGSWVMLPEPVSPATTTTWCWSTAAAISRTRAEIGSSSGKRMGLVIREDQGGFGGGLGPPPTNSAQRGRRLGGACPLAGRGPVGSVRGDRGVGGPAAAAVLAACAPPRGEGALRGSCGGRAAEAAGPRARERGRRWWPPRGRPPA